jgi:drug/metabolite transporter (DMT)-like permease
VHGAVTRRSRGYLAIVLAAVLFGIWPTLSKLVLAEMRPLAIAFIVQALSGLALAPTLRRVRVQRRDWRFIGASAILGSAVGPLTYFYGLERTTAANSVLLSNSESLFTILLAYVFLAERATRREYIALAGIAVGAFLVTTQLRFGDVEFAGFLVGNMLLVASAASWGFSNTMSTMLVRRIPIASLVSLQLLIGAGVLLPFVILTQVSLGVPVSVLPLLVFLSLTAVGMFSVLFFYAFRTIGAMRTGAVLPTSALWGILLALYVFPTETLTLIQILGGALMAGALIAFYVFRGPATTGGEGETLKPSASDGPDSP